MTFKNLDLDPKLLKALKKMGFTEPTPIQQAVIPKIIDGRSDLVGLAQTGTGKTAAFGLPMLHLLKDTPPHLQGVIICPTRELCLQITRDLEAYAQFLPQIRIVAVYGGSSMREQIVRIKRGMHVMVATPGRLLDLINRKVVPPQQIRFVVLDEADEMLSMGFQEDINEILSHTPDTKRTWLFSATMPSTAARIASAYMKNPQEVALGRLNTTAENIDHLCYVVREKDRYKALKRLIDFEPHIYGLIFCRTRAETRTVSEKLVRDGYLAEALHGDMSQEQRNQVMHKYRQRSIQLLVATDVAARGIDVADITHVINYNLPDEAERYTHRSGRTARAGKSGVSLILVNTREVRRLSNIEQQAGIRFRIAKVPQGREICEKQLFAMVDKMVRVEINHAEIAPYLPPVYEALKALSKEELLQRFVSIEFNRFLAYYRDTGDLNAGPAAAGRPQKSTPHRPQQAMVRFFINVGRLDHINEGAIVRLVCEKAGIRSSKIGQIDLKREFSFFDVDKRVAQKVLRGLKNAKLDNRTIKIKPVENGKHPAPRRRKKK